MGCSTSGIIKSVSVCSSNKAQGNRRDQVEQENTDLVQRHASVVQSVKLLDRQMKPSAMPSMYPIVCEQEAQPPHEQDAIVDHGTPKQCLTYYRDTHELPPPHGQCTAYAMAFRCLPSPGTILVPSPSSHVRPGG